MKKYCKMFEFGKKKKKDSSFTNKTFRNSTVHFSVTLCYLKFQINESIYIVVLSVGIQSSIYSFSYFFLWSNCVGYRPKNTHAGFAIVLKS